MAGLNPNISYLHSFQNKKPTLIFDVIEEFRQALVDRPLFSLMTKGKKHRKFKVDPKSGLLDTYTRQTVLENVLNRLSTLINFRGGKVQAGEIIRFQIKNMAAYISGKAKGYRPFIATY